MFHFHLADSNDHLDDMENGVLDFSCSFTGTKRQRRLFMIGEARQLLLCKRPALPLS